MVEVIERYPDDDGTTADYNVDTVYANGRYVAVFDGQGACACNICEPNAGWCGVRMVMERLRLQGEDGDLDAFLRACEGFPDTPLTRCPTSQDDLCVSFAIYDSRLGKLYLSGPNVRAVVMKNGQPQFPLPKIPGIRPNKVARSAAAQAGTGAIENEPEVARVDVRDASEVALMTDGFLPALDLPDSLEAAEDRLAAIGGQEPIRFFTSHQPGVHGVANFTHRAFVRFKV
ncbi:hypothetical protein [Nocardioides sp. YIM 152588]|uniref:hypothetical protein n=1 Tax=Nocardioides sp. YIM 152588 TaxID=3158259 RepID=UPI0032E4E130